MMIVGNQDDHAWEAMSKLLCKMQWSGIDCKCPICNRTKEQGHADDCELRNAIHTNTWEGRAMIGGRVSKASQNITLTTNLIKNELGIALNPEEQRAEQAFLRGNNG